MKKILFLLFFGLFATFAIAQEDAVEQKLSQAVDAANQKNWSTAVTYGREALAMVKGTANEQECACILAQLLALQSSDEWNKGDSTVAFTHINEAAELCPGNDFVQLHWQMQHLMQSIGIGNTAGRQEEEKYLKATIERAQTLGIANERLRNELSLIYIGYGMSRPSPPPTKTARSGHWHRQAWGAPTRHGHRTRRFVRTTSTVSSR